jgi:glycerol uptake facilitator protein
MRTHSYREFMAEMFGTMFILLFGNGVVAMTTLFNLGGYTDITIAWGIGVFLGILVSARISGAHLNPAVSLALVITKRFPAKKLPLYISAQMIGGFLGAALVYYFYSAKFAIVDPNLSTSASIFSTFPALSAFMPSFMAEFIATALLMFGILSIIDHFTFDKAAWLSPFAIGALIVAIGMSFGGMHGYAMNPARDFSPRLFTAIMGFKNNGLTDGSMIWVVPVLGPLLGGPIGALLYDFTLGKHLAK